MSNITISGEMAFELASNYRTAVRELREAGAEAARMAEKIDRDLAAGRVSELGLYRLPDMQLLVGQVNQYAALMRGFGFDKEFILAASQPNASVLGLLRDHLMEEVDAELKAEAAAK